MSPIYQPKTGKPCTCRKGVQRDNCASCEGTGWVIDFAAIRARRTTTPTPTPTTPHLTAEALALLRRFISPEQFTVLLACLHGEEKQFFIEKLAQLAALIAGMPVTYEQEGKGEEATVYLHYFAGGQGNWYITEKDVETADEPGQHQAFGLADLFNDGGELGYISIIELIQNRAEIDLYFTPCTLAELRKKRGH